MCFVHFLILSTNMILFLFCTCRFKFVIQNAGGGGYVASVQLQSGRDKTCSRSMHAAGHRLLTSLSVMTIHLRSLKNRTCTIRYNSCLTKSFSKEQHSNITKKSITKFIRKRIYFMS